MIGKEDKVATVTPTAVPSDPLFGQQWHLLNSTNPGVDLNVIDLWEEYGGRGVLIAVIDDGVDYSHADLAGSYDTSRDFDARDGDDDAFTSDPGDRHGTAVSGVIAATQDNGIGGSGVAPDAQIVGFRTGFGANSSSNQVTAAFQQAINVDVANNSWSYGGYFFDDLTDETLYLWPTGEIGSLADSGRALESAVTLGRDGLGTVFVFSAGNGRSDGQDVNYHGFQNSPDTISVAAIAQSGAVASFSTPGAAVLVAAPGVGIVTTDRPGSAGYVSGDAVSISGTSFSAPATSGVIAIMLEANPDLGYRDVQEILAYSARNPVASEAGWQTNGSDSWNGGGLTVSHDYGFGLIDAHAAVRLAEVWNQQHTKTNLLQVSASSVPGVAITDNGTVSDSIAISDSGILIDQITVTLDLSHGQIGDLVLTLQSPSGTSSVLVNRPGATASNPAGAPQDDIQFTLSSVQFWGETGDGDWTLSVTDSAAGNTGILNSWTLALLGDPLSADSLYIYTEEIARHAGEAERQTLSDSVGIDTINAAAVTSGSVIDLSQGATSTIHGVPIALAAGTTIENAIGGDGPDRLFGNETDNILQGVRGDDTLDGLGGDDTLLGGDGDDNLRGGKGADELYGGRGEDSLVGGAGNDLLDGGGGADTLDGGGGGDTLGGDTGNDTIAGGGGDDILSGQDGTDLLNGGSGSDSLFGGGGDDTLGGGSGDDLAKGGGDDDRLAGNAGSDLLIGGSGNDQLLGGDGEDSLFGGKGEDELFGGPDNDFLKGGSNNDTLFGGNGNDTLNGGSGDDSLFGDGNDSLIGGGGNDSLFGGVGDDLLFGGAGDDVLTISDVGLTRLSGGAGSDTLRLDGGGLLDLTAIPDNRIENFEAIDLGAGGAADAATLSLDLRELLNLSNESNRLLLTGDASDSVNPGGLTDSGLDETIGGTTFDVFTDPVNGEAEELLIQQGVMVA